MKPIMRLKFSLIMVLLFNTVYVSAVNYDMSTTAITVNSGDVYRDPQGAANYANNQNITQLMNACNTSSVIVLYFPTLTLGSGDTLWVYDGSTVYTPLLGRFTGTPASRITLVSRGSTLLFRFKSDASGVAQGWEATIKCINLNDPPTASTAYGSPCHDGPGGLNPFCTDNNTEIRFESGTTGSAGVFLSDAGPGCLGSSPGPAWYVMKINTPGDLLIYIEQRRSSNNALIDVDFICWGPFRCSSLHAFHAALCGQAFTFTTNGGSSHRPTNGNHNNGNLGGYPTGNIIDCSFYADPTEWCFIPNGQQNEFYLLLLTNYARAPGHITFGREGSSTADTDCDLMGVITSNSPVCVGGTLQLTTLNPEAGALYQWGGPNGFSSSSPDPVIYGVTPANSGTYYMIKRVGDRIADTAFTEVIIGEPVYTNVTDTCCAGGTYTRYGFSIPVPTPGYYRGTLNLSSIYGCDSIVTLSLRVGGYPAIGASVNNPCIANTASISITASGGIAPYQYTWNTGASTSSINQLPSGTYTVTVADSVNCKSTHTEILEANDLNATANTTPSYCTDANGSAIVHVSGGSGNYTFLPDGSNVMPVSRTNSDFLFANLWAGNYSVAITDSACTYNVNFTIINFGDPKATFSSVYDPHNIEIPVRFTNHSRNATSYLWNFGDGNLSTDENPIYAYSEYGQYVVTMLATDNYNCVDSFSNVINLIELAHCHLPTAFTPNGNDVNDTFGPFCHKIQKENFLFAVYDRWGNKVFESQDVTQHWDGTINGKEPMPGVYVWYLAYRDELHRLQERRGTVTVVL